MELLENKDNYKIVGFYSMECLSPEIPKLLQTIYLINGKYYVLYQKEDIWSDIIMYLDAISNFYDKKRCYYEISEFMSQFDDNIIGQDTYELFEIDIANISSLVVFDKNKVLMSEYFRIDDNHYNGAIGLDNGIIALGDEEFLEKSILENVTDKKRRYELLEEIYDNYYDFEKRRKIIDDFMFEFGDSLDNMEKRLWKEKRINNSLSLYALSLAETSMNDAKKSTEEKKILQS